MRTSFPDVGKIRSYMQLYCFEYALLLEHMGADTHPLGWALAHGSGTQASSPMLAEAQVCDLCL